MTLRKRIYILALALFLILPALQACSVTGGARPASQNAALSAAGLSKIVVLDPGHGGSDPGCVHGDVYESAVNLAVALKAKALLEELGYEVKLTREDDSDLSLQQRVDFAAGVTDGVLVSIHQNALEGDTETHGIETWYNRETNELSELLALCLQDEVTASSNAKDRGIKADTGLVVIREVKMPSCLIETGFLSSTDERANLVSEEYQALLAQGIADGVDSFFSAA